VKDSKDVEEGAEEAKKHILQYTQSCAGDNIEGTSMFEEMKDDGEEDDETIFKFDEEMNNVYEDGEEEKNWVKEMAKQRARCWWKEMAEGSEQAAPRRIDTCMEVDDWQDAEAQSRRKESH
jgi:hypothetical protein